MGTRNLTCVVKDGTHRIAQYGQWDGYPSGQGLTVLDFLTNGNVEALKENIMKCSYVTDAEYSAMWREVGYDADTQLYVDSETGRKFNAKYPQFSRDVAAEILQMVADSPSGLKLMDDYHFAADSLFCEWAYVVDFDKNTFEIYEGFNKNPLNANDRFFGVTCAGNDKEDKKGEYEPVKMIAMYNLDELPTAEEFLSQCERSEDDEE